MVGPSTTEGLSADLSRAVEGKLPACAAAAGYERKPFRGAMGEKVRAGITDSGLRRELNSKCAPSRGGGLPVKRETGAPKPRDLSPHACTALLRPESND